MTRRGIYAVILVLWSTLLLSIGISRPWRLVHEDNGALHTSLALSHVREGLAATRAHNWLVPKQGGDWFAYPHHPPGVGLIVAAAFEIAGASPAAARAVMIVIAMANVLLVFFIARMLFADESIALAAALFFATVPMQSFFGRMVNFEPPTMLFVLLLLAGYVRWHRDRSNGALVLMGCAAIGGLFFDWPVLFFCAAIVVVDGIAWLRRRESPAAALVVASGAAIGMAVALAHIAWAFGSLDRLFDVAGKDVGAGHDPLRVTGWLSLMFENYRHYFTTSGLITSIVAAVTIFRRTTRDDLRCFLIVAGGAALLYLLASPNRARLHHYWQYYFLPFAALAFAMALTWLRARRANAVVALMVLEIAVATGYKLYRRHTEPGEWAVKAVEHAERLYLSP